MAKFCNSKSVPTTHKNVYTTYVVKNYCFLDPVLHHPIYYFNGLFATKNVRPQILHQSVSARPVALHTKVPLHTVLYRCLGDSFIVQAFMGGIMIWFASHLSYFYELFATKNVGP